MPRHLQRDLDLLSKELLGLGGMVESQTNKAITALFNRDRSLAREVVEGDEAINVKETQIEEQALKILALHQPVANDLRFIITTLKVNNDLERIADLAVNIASRALTLIDMEPFPLPADFDELVKLVHVMVEDSLNALVKQDAGLARSICEIDDRVDEINAATYERMQQVIRDDPSKVAPAICMISVSRHLERIADQATNIAEDVVFMVEGEIIRHNL